MDSAAVESLGAMVKAQDRERWLSAQWVAAGVRPALLAVHALDLELQRVVAEARETMLAEIRLAWWREQLQALAAGSTAPAEPHLQALHDSVLPAGVDLTALAEIERGFQPLLDTGTRLDALALAEARGRPLFAALLRIALQRAPDAGESAAADLAGTRWALACLWRGGWGRVDDRLRHLSPPAFPPRPTIALPAPLATLDALAMDDWQRMCKGRMLRRIASPVRQWKMARAALASA